MNRKVCLKSFNGVQAAPPDGRPEENYWRLIGHCGEVVAPRNAGGRLLVKFDVPVSSFGVYCHNPLENSLLILESDLCFLDLNCD